MPSRSPTPSDTPGIIRHDFGKLLARGDWIECDFPVENRSSNSWRILDSVAIKSCCSKILSVPKSVPPAGTSTVRVAINPGWTSGKHAIDFQLATDRTERPALLLRAFADFTPAWEVQEEGATSVPAGATAEKRLKCFARWFDDGRSLAGGPTKFSIDAPFVWSFSGEAVATAPHEGEPGEWSREIVGRMPNTESPGSHRAAMTFRWPDGVERVHTIRFEIAPRITCSPSELVISRSNPPERLELTVRSAEAPFRVLGVSGAIVAGYRVQPEAAAILQRISLDLLPVVDSSPQPASREIIVETDAPAGRKLRVGVLILP